MSHTILVAEDDARIADLICRYLQMEEFLYHRADSGEHAMSLFEQINPDLVILDIMLPQMDGMTVCEKIREKSDVPIIMVTALGDEDDRLNGFAQGADDYVCKPFNPRELIARIKAIFRRYNPDAPKPNFISYDVIHMDLEERIVKIDDVRVDLTQIEFNLLRLFLTNPRRVLSREMLRNGSHDSFAESYSRSVDFHIKNLRRKINTKDDLNFIRTIYGVGYKLV